jgi:energy-coupling factor transporter ATP-binding protein EcfA2
MRHHSEFVRRFESFEDREAYLRGPLNVPIPRRHQGPAVFFSDLKAAMRIVERPSYALVTPNPLDCLPFDRVGLILTAAANRAGRTTSPGNYNQILHRFDLSSLVDRLVYTLSGGELLRLAMAQSALVVAWVNKLIMAAPWGTLSATGMASFDELISIYDTNDRSIELLALTGDDETEPSTLANSDRNGAVFGLRLQSVRIPLSDHQGEEGHYAHVIDFDHAPLLSPCLISGENGHGKSLLMKAIAGALPYSGLAEVFDRPNSRVRLVFQDVANQALLMTSSLSWAIQQNPVAMHLNQLLDEMICRELKRDVTVLPPTLLATKSALIALRLSERPAALILDEPDWGLSRNEAIALFNATNELCDYERVPLIVITHRRWFDNSFRSQLRIERLSDPAILSAPLGIKIHFVAR